jgi:hypothetical protein
MEWEWGKRRAREQRGGMNNEKKRCEGEARARLDSTRGPNKEKKGGELGKVTREYSVLT